MNEEDRLRDWAQRISEITGLHREVTAEAWATFVSLGSAEKAANHLGITPTYFWSLTEFEVLSQLHNGEVYARIAHVLGADEESLWHRIREKFSVEQLPMIERDRNIWAADKLATRFGDSKNSDSKSSDALARTNRDLLALGLARRGWSLEDISKILGVSRERVRQVLKNKFNFNIRQYKEKVKSDLTDEISKWIRSHPGCTYLEISEALNITSAEAASRVQHTDSHLIIEKIPHQRNGANYSTFTRDSMLEAIRQAHQLRNLLQAMYSSAEVRPLTGGAYERLRTASEITGPSTTRIIQVFGSWSEACQLAGVPCESPNRSEYNRRWTDDDLLNQVSSFLLGTESSSYETFEQWSRVEFSRASAALVRNQLGLTWSELKQEALSRLRSTWIGLYTEI